MNSKGLTSNKGLTFIEVIMGMALLAIISVVLLSLFTSSMFIAVRAGDKTKNVSSASGIAENAIAGAVIQDTGTNSILVDGISIKDVIFEEDDTVVLTVDFNNTGNTRNVDVKKIIIKKYSDTVNGSTIQSDVEVYIP